MTPRALIGSLPLLLLTTALAACDPAYTYQPREWPTMDVGVRPGWLKLFDGGSLEARRMLGLVGSEVLAAEFTIHNQSRDAIVVERVDVIAGVSRLHSAPLDDVTKTVPPHATERLTAVWRFDRPVIEVLQQRPQIQFTLSAGQREVFITLDYERVR